MSKTLSKSVRVDGLQFIFSFLSPLSRLGVTRVQGELPQRFDRSSKRCREKKKEHVVLPVAIRSYLSKLGVKNVERVREIERQKGSNL